MTRRTDCAWCREAAAVEGEQPLPFTGDADFVVLICRTHGTPTAVARQHDLEWTDDRVPQVRALLEEDFAHRVDLSDVARSASGGPTGGHVRLHLKLAGGSQAKVPQELADEWTHIAQRYVGYWYGHHLTGVQWETTFHRGPEWREPAVFADDCRFCARMSDESVEQRVAGYQYAMDIESARLSGSGSRWPDYAFLKADPRRLRRAIAELDPEARTSGGTPLAYAKAYDFVGLPFRLKWKLCVEWNHLLLDFLEKHPEWRYVEDERRFERTGATPPPPVVVTEPATLPTVEDMAPWL